MYWAEGGKALSTSQTALYQELVDSGMSRKKAYETIRDFNDATADLEADKEENGNPVSGSKKEKVVEAINNDIVMRYGYQAGVIEHSLPGDKEVKQAIGVLENPEEYARITREQDTQRK